MSAEEEKQLLTSDDDYVQINLEVNKRSGEERVDCLTRIKSIPHVGYVLMFLAACANAAVGYDYYLSTNRT